MTEQWTIYACLALSLCTAMVGGVLQSFSDFVMRGLIQVQGPGGIQAMQMINRTVYRSVFVVMLIALAPVLLAFAVFAAFELDSTASVWIGVASAVYMAAVFLVTALGNVPMNRTLDGMSADNAATSAYWRDYGQRWTRLNHIRTIGSGATAACLMIAAVRIAGA